MTLVEQQIVVAIEGSLQAGLVAADLLGLLDCSTQDLATQYRQCL